MTEAANVLYRPASSPSTGMMQSGFLCRIGQVLRTRECPETDIGREGYRLFIMLSNRVTRAGVQPAAFPLKDEFGWVA